MTKRTAQRESQREELRGVPEGRAVAIGRDGKPVYRRRTPTTDPFYVPPEIVPNGWKYEWKTYTVFNQRNPGYEARLNMNTWTPVPADRHPGMWVPDGTEGAVIVEGLMLMERPMVIHQEALQEERDAAKAALASQQALFGQRVGDGERVVRQKNTGIRIEEGGIEITGGGEYDLA